MSAVIEVRDLSKRYRDVTAVDDATFSVGENKIYGLLGRNGAGKTTLMQLLTGQEFPSGGSISVFGQSPVENAGVLQNISFIKESQRYPEDFKPKHVFASAPCDLLVEVGDANIETGEHVGHDTQHGPRRIR